MKWVFYLLLLVNVAYFAWQIGYVESPTVSPVEVPDSLSGKVNRLLLFHEVDPSQLQLRAALHTRHAELPDTATTTQIAATQKPVMEAEPVTEPVAKTAPVAELVAKTEPVTRTEPVAELTMKTKGEEDSRVCRRIGPLSQKTEISAVNAWLKAQGIAMASETHERRSVPLHWVYFPPFKTRVEANEYAARLEKDGIKDIYVLPKGKMDKAISLGVFSQRASMETRIADLKGKGYSPAVGSRIRTEKVTWFDIVSPTKAAFPEVDFSRKFPSLEVTSADCGR